VRVVVLFVIFRVGLWCVVVFLLVFVLWFCYECFLCEGLKYFFLL